MSKLFRLLRAIRNFQIHCLFAECDSEFDLDTTSPMQGYP